jgi:hypothetical protein
MTRMLRKKYVTGKALKEIEYLVNFYRNKNNNRVRKIAF